MPTIEVNEVDKKRIDSIRKPTPNGRFAKESFAIAVKRILDENESMRQELMRK